MALGLDYLFSEFLDHASRDADCNRVLAKQLTQRERWDGDDFTALSRYMPRKKHHNWFFRATDFVNVLMQDSIDIHVDPTSGLNLLHFDATGYGLLSRLGKGLNAPHGNINSAGLLLFIDNYNQGNTDQPFLDNGSFCDARGIYLFSDVEMESGCGNQMDECMVVMTKDIGRYNFCDVRNSSLSLQRTGRRCAVDAYNCEIYVEAPGRDFAEDAVDCEITCPSQLALDDIKVSVGKGNKLFLQESDGSKTLVYTT